MSRVGVGLDALGRWRIAVDGEPVGDEDGYPTREAATEAAEQIDPDALVVVEDPDRLVEVYRDAGDEWRWRRIATSNGKTVGDSAEGYTRKAAARTAAERENPGVPIVEVA